MIVASAYAPSVPAVTRAAPAASISTVVVVAPKVNTEELPAVSNAGPDSRLADVQVPAPEIRVGLRYATSDNFTGAPIAGYEGNHAYLRREAATALALVARKVTSKGLGPGAGASVTAQAPHGVGGVRELRQGVVALELRGPERGTLRSRYPLIAIDRAAAALSHSR
jgi:hypothetical protein